MYPGATAPVVSIADTVTSNVSPAFNVLGALTARCVTWPVAFTAVAVAVVGWGRNLHGLIAGGDEPDRAPMKVCDPASAAVNAYGMPASAGLKA